jgi:hypothetical protein
MRFFDLKTILNLVLLVAIALLISFWPKPVDNSEPFKRAVHEKELIILEQSQIITRLAQKSKADSLRLAKDSIANKIHVSKLESHISQLKGNPRVVYIRQQEPIIDSLITAQDSLVRVSTERVATLEGELFSLRQDMSKVFVDCEKRFQEQLDTEKLYQAENERLAKEVKKQRRGKKLAQVAAVIGTVGAFILGSR